CCASGRTKSPEKRTVLNPSPPSSSISVVHSAETGPPCRSCGPHGPRVASVGRKASPSGTNSASGIALLRLGDRAPVRAGDQAGVLGQHPGRVARFGELQVLAARRERLVVDNLVE